MRIGRILAAIATAATLVACGASGTATGVGSIQPRDGKSGLQLSGTLGNRQVAVNDGAPVLRLGDCDVNDGADEDLCFFSREVEGGFFALIVENPDVITPGKVAVVDPSCVSPYCQDVADGAVVELQVERGGERMRASGGTINVTTAERGQRYAGTMALEFGDGRISGSFQVVPRPEEDE